MALIIGVHGIAQQQLGRQQLAAVWGPSLADGVEAALSGRHVGTLPLDLAYYGRLFLDMTGPAGAGSKGAQPRDELAGLAEDELDDLLDAAAEIVGAEALRVAEAQTPKSLMRSPRAVQLVFRAVDWRYGPGAALLFVGVFKQVRLYLRDARLKAAIDSIVDAAMAKETKVLVGHSLGSVVAFEYVRQHPEHRLALLVTLGSPLGARFVRALMPDPNLGADGLPPGVDAWVNVRDPRDPVAFAGDLARRWQQIQDLLVDNGNDAHAASRYLGKRQTGAAVLAALPELAP
ncbi:hypothetical protein ACFY0P_49260 [Streptomyces sp. NPDC001714]|uniref:hypothetical protein n=1 Tax=Streptomyces sp. NPDC001714 TaxID=3364603 RepID=UPI0036AE937F